MARKGRQVEKRMVNEYILAAYPKFRSLTAVPLGRVDESLMAKVGYKSALGISRPYRPEIDAIVFLPRYLVLLEAKVWNVLNGLSKLSDYAELVPFTPELKDYQGLEIIMELVVGWTNANLEIMARKRGVKVVVFNPPWIAAEVERMHLYWTKEYQEERERKLRMREVFGVE